MTWVYTGAGRSGARARPPAAEKAAITAACESFIAEVLKPRFLPEIRPTAFNYPVDITGKWHGANYRFIQRFRSAHAHAGVPPEAEAPEFDAPFARLEYVARDRFDLSYRRYTEQWFRLYRSVSLAEALALILEDGHLHPV